MLKRSQSPGALYITLSLALVAMCALAVVAQSGRRVRKSESPPVPVPTPEATPTPTPKEKPKPAFTFIVGLDKYSEFSRVSPATYGGVLRSCADRLGDSRSVAANVASQDMSRSDAVRLAKAEKEAYIVLLQLRPNTNSGQSSGMYDDNVYIQYAVLAPVTAKQVTAGSTFPEAYRNKRVGLPTSTTNGDYYLNQAARGAAERILDHFDIRLPNTLP